MKKIKNGQRLQITFYLSEEERNILLQLTKRLNSTISDTSRKIILAVALHPEYDFLFDDKVLFNIDPQEIELTQQILPHITELVKTISDLSKDFSQHNNTQE